MESRPASVTPGARAWLHQIHQYPLPERLHDRQPVTVLSCGSGSMDLATVETSDGSTASVRMISIDAGHLYRLRGRDAWLPESDPVVLDALQERLTAHRGTEQPHGIADDHATYLSMLEFTLRRNGRTP